MAKGKLPAIMFYTGDWFKDQDLSKCGPATRGIWVDMLFRMHENGRSGTIDGTPEQLSRSCHCTPDEMLAAVNELASTETADVWIGIPHKEGSRKHRPLTVSENVTLCHTFVTIINRKMKRESDERKSSKDRQIKHRGTKVKKDVTEMSQQDNTPLSSSSSITPSEEGENPAPDDLNPKYAAVIEAWCKRTDISPLHMKARDREYIEQYARERGVDWCIAAIKKTSEVYLGRCFVSQDELDKKRGKVDSRDAIAPCSVSGCSKRYYQHHKKKGYLCFGHWKEQEELEQAAATEG